MKLRNMALAGTLMLAVVACEDDKASEVSGARDDIKKVAAVKEVSHKEKKTKRECTRRVNGSCKSYKTVPDGWEKVVDKPGKPARWCVELDNVNGSAKDDDVWYTTSQTVYLKAQALEEGETLKFTPVHSGCW